MKNLDSLTLKFFYDENKNFFDDGVIQKIQMPTRSEVLFYIRSNGKNLKFYININPKYPHMCFINNKEDYSIKIPKTPPMFCMQLRKYLEGAKIVKSNLVQYDRILEFYFCTVDEFGFENSLVLSIELMGKYSNIILYNKKTGLILGSAHNVSQDKSQVREIYGGIKYIYPPSQIKKDILKISYSTFLENSDNISENFYYFSKPYSEFLLNGTENKEELFKKLQLAVFDPSFIKDFWNNKENFNEIIFNYFSKIVNGDLVKNKKNKLLKIVKTKLKGLKNIVDEKFDYDKYEKYKNSGDLIFQYIYLIKKGEKEVEFNGIKIKLDENLTPAQNAQRYYKLYSKLKAAKDILEKRKNEAKISVSYYENILFSIENADKLNILDEIEEEITPTKKEKTEKPIIETIKFKNFEIYIGKNNKQNDFLIRKLSNSEDIWFHSFNCPSSHVIVKTENGKKKPDNEILLYAAKLVKENSKMKNSTHAEIIYTKRKYLKRPPNTPLGYVTYENEKEIIV